MGVPKLLSTLAPFAERLPLDGAQVVVDGPALAYHAVKLCQTGPATAIGRSHPLDQPTYAQLGEAAIAWLDELRNRDISILALYFDGYLPETKRPVRLERTYRTSAELKDVFVSYQHDTLPGFDVKGPRRGSRLPAPAFTVPAVLDALHQSAIYGPLTRLVPGEADTFCAEKARTAGGGAVTVITSDSDLLVQEMRPGATVVLFQDIELRGAEAGKPLVVTTYSPVAIGKRLGLRADHGLYSFAFELFMDPQLSVTELVEGARQHAAASAYPGEYAAFTEQYAGPGWLAASAEKYDIDGLDPRVSEFALQYLCPSALESSTGTDRDCDGKSYDIDILVFVPQLPESWTRANAWEASAHLRQCAYSLLQFVAGRRTAAVREYTRVASLSSRGSRLDLLSAAEVGQALSSLQRLLDQIQPQIEEPALHWVALAAYQDIMWSRRHAKESACLGVLCQEASEDGVLDRVTWNAVHWLAQIQATLYSLRILRQLLGFVGQQVAEAQLEQTLPMHAEIYRLLSSVTPLAEHPTLRTLQNLPARLKNAGALALLSRLADMPEPIEFRTASRSKKKKATDKKRKRSEQKAEKPNSSRTSKNPFSIFDGAE